MNRNANPQYKAATLLMAVPTVYAKLLETSVLLPEEIFILALSAARRMRLHACGSAGYSCISSILDKKE